MYLSRYGCIGCDSALLERFKGYTTVKEVIIEIYTSTCAGGDVVSRKNCNHHPYLFALDCIPERYQPLNINQQRGEPRASTNLSPLHFLLISFPLSFVYLVTRPWLRAECRAAAIAYTENNLHYHEP